MSTTLSVSPSTQASIDQAKERLAGCKHRLLTTFSFVPDDKLGYTVSTTTRSPLRIAAHAGLSNYFFAGIIRGTAEFGPDAMAAIEEAEKKELDVTTRQQAIDIIEQSTMEVIAAIESLTDETAVKTVVTPILTAPMAFWTDLPARHMDNHAAQIDYIQTIWGDKDWHMM